MIDIVVSRVGGSTFGEGIVSPLLSTTSVALARGASELDANSLAGSTVTLTVIYSAGVVRGMLLEAFDALTGSSWRGKIIRIRHLSSATDTVTELQVLRYAY